MSHVNFRDLLNSFGQPGKNILPLGKKRSAIIRLIRVRGRFARDPNRHFHERGQFEKNRGCNTFKAVVPNPFVTFLPLPILELFILIHIKKGVLNLMEVLPNQFCSYRARNSSLLCLSYNTSHLLDACAVVHCALCTVQCAHLLIFAEYFAPIWRSEGLN